MISHNEIMDIATDFNNIKIVKKYIYIINNLNIYKK